jgi:serine/threonine protein kinase/WD40 repeat protein
MSEESSDLDPFEVLAESFLARYRAGERPSVDELAAQHPELAGPIRKLLPALVRIERDLSISHVSAPDAASVTPKGSPAKEQRLGDYLILREIGRGGMGVVYEAEQLSLGRRVALKVLPGHVARDGVALERFRREAKSAARLHHTNIVPVFEVGRDGDVAYFAMQFIQGQGLDQVIDELARLRGLERKPGASNGPRAAAGETLLGLARPRVGPVAESILSGRFATEAAVPARGIAAHDATEPPETEPVGQGGIHNAGFVLKDPEIAQPCPTTPHGHAAVLPGGNQVSTVQLSGRRAPFFRSVAQIGRQAAQGLAYAHASGLVHRDIKPSNLLLDHAGVLWIADFGLAKGEDEGLTETGDILGTLRYMAPERFRGQGDARSDLYALGLTLYELLTLRPGFESADRLKLVEKINSEDPRKPRSLDPRIPLDLETIVLKAIEKDPKARYQSAEAMAEDLRRFLADEPIKARQVSAAERYWRWARRNPVIAVMGGALTALLIAVTIVSLLAASHFNTIARSESLANQQSQLDRKDAIQARLQAIEERDRSRQLSSSLAFDRGIALGEEGRADHGLFWMLEALKTAPKDAEGFRNAVRWNLGAWLGQVHKPLRISVSIGPCTHLGFSPDGKTFATGFCPRDRDRATPIVLWDTASGARLKTLTGALAPFAYRADGKVLYATAEPRGVLAFELATERVLWTTDGLPGDYPFAIDVSSDGSTVLAVRHDVNDGLFWLSRLDSATGHPRGESLELPGVLALSPGGETAAAVRSENGEVRIDLYRLPADRRLVSWSTRGSALGSGAFSWRFSPDGGSLFGTILRGGILYQDDARASQIWDTDQGQPLSPIMVSTEHSIYSPAADRLLTQTNNMWLLRRAPDGQSMGAGFPVGTIAHTPQTHPDGLTILDVLSDSALQLWQISTEAEPIAAGRSDNRLTLANPRLDRETQDVSLLANGFATDGRIALTSARGVAGREQIQVSDLATGQPLGRPSPHYPGWVIRGLALSPDGRSIATGSNPDGRTAGEVRLWDTSTGRLRFPPLPHTNYVAALAFQPDGKVLASGDYSGLVRLWNSSTGKELGRPLPQGEIVLSLAYSPDGKVLAAGLSSDHTDKPGIRLWDTETREIIGEFLPSTQPVRRIEFRSDGRALLAVHMHYTQLWDTTSGRAIGGPMSDETSGGFRLDGRALLTLARDGTVKLRDATTGAVLSRLMAASSPAICGAFRGAGDLVAVGFQDGSVRLCDPATSQPIGPPRFMEHAINKVAFTPDGNSVAGIDIAGNTRTWPVPRPRFGESLDDLKLRIEARTGLQMENDRTIARLDTSAWRERLEQLGRLDPAAMRPEVDPAWHEPMVREAEQHGNAFAAIWHLDRLIAARPEDWFLYAQRARACSSSDQFDKAAGDYRQAERVGKREDVLDFQAHRVLDSEQTGRWAEALWYLDRLIAARPDDALLHEDRAAVYGKLGREADRQAELARVFELGADEGLVIPRAEELGRAGRWLEAAGLLARCGRAGPVSRELRQAWAIACLKGDDRVGYREACAAFLAQEGTDPTVVWNALSAASLLALGSGAMDDYRVPISWFEKRLSATPTPVPVLRHFFLNALGGLLLRAGRMDEAIARINEGLAVKGRELPSDWAYLVLALARKENGSEARRCLDRLHAALPDPQFTFWDLQELDLLRAEAESLIFDAAFPSYPFQGPETR